MNTEFLSDVWTRIDSVFSEQKVAKYKVAEKCGFERKTLISRSNINLTYFARLCEVLNVSADFFLFGLEKDKEKTCVAAYSPDKNYKDMPTQREIIKEAKKMMKYKGNDISINNRCGISAQKELMILVFCIEKMCERSLRTVKAMQKDNRRLWACIRRYICNKE